MLLRLIRGLFAGKDPAPPSLPVADLDARVEAANRLMSLWRVEEAIAACGEALAAAPANAELFSAYLLHSHYAATIDAQELFARHVRFGALLERTVAPTYRGRWHTAPDPERRLRVGYVSRNLSQHSVGYFVEPVIEHHDRKRFEVYCYYTHPLSDDVTASIAAKADVWRHLPDVDAGALAARIFDDRIDVLIDLGGHTKSNRLAAFAREPAPIQMTWLGYPDTTGVRSIRYRITDAIADPRGAADERHTETLLRLEPPFLCYRPPDDAPAVTVRDAGQPLVFGSFNVPAKLTDAQIAVWCRVLAALPDSRLVLKGQVLQNPPAAARVTARFAGHGIAASRIDLRGWVDARRAHLDAYGAIDIALDTFPYNGTTTTCEALWMGVPVITLAGEVHMSRVGASLLTSAGLGELVTHTPDDYVAAAVGLAADLPRRERLRAGMRERLLRSAFLDHAGHTRKLEGAYRDAWRAWYRTQLQEGRT